MSATIEIKMETLAATQALAELLVQVAPAPMTIALVGSLGAGKTQFVRYFAAALDITKEDVSSPTYVLLQRYVGSAEIFHIDFYRLESPEQVWDLGIDELYDQAAWILVEWADRFPECLPRDHLRIEIIHTGHDDRVARLSANGSKSQQLLSRLPH